MSKRSIEEASFSGVISPPSKKVKIGRQTPFIRKGFEQYIHNQFDQLHSSISAITLQLNELNKKVDQLLLTSVRQPLLTPEEVIKYRPVKSTWKSLHDESRKSSS